MSTIFRTKSRHLIFLSVLFVILFDWRCSAWRLFIIIYYKLPCLLTYFLTFIRFSAIFIRCQTMLT